MSREHLNFCLRCGSEFPSPVQARECKCSMVAYVKRRTPQEDKEHDDIARRNQESADKDKRIKNK